MNNIVLTEVEFTKISLKPGDVLMVKLISDIIGENDLDGLREQLKKRFPNNEISVICLPVGNDIVFSAVQSKEVVDCSVKVCDDCTCGKANINQGDRQ
jgi:hypothetical protein